MDYSEFEHVEKYRIFAESNRTVLFEGKVAGNGTEMAFFVPYFYQETRSC